MKINVPLFACQQKKLDELNEDLFIVAPLRLTRDGGPYIVPGYGLYFICEGPCGDRAARLLSCPMIRVSLKDVRAGDDGDDHWTFMTISAEKLVISLQEN